MYVNIYLTDLYEICRICRTLAVHERSDVIFRSLKGRGNQFCGDKIDFKSTLVIRLIFARAAPPAYDKGNCCAGRRQTNYLIRWTQANQLSNKLTIINRLLER